MDDIMKLSNEELEDIFSEMTPEELDDLAIKIAELQASLKEDLVGE